MEEAELQRQLILNSAERFLANIDAVSGNSKTYINFATFEKAFKQVIHMIINSSLS